MYRSLLIAIHRAIIQAIGTNDVSISTNAHIVDGTYVDDGNMISYFTHLRSMFIRIVIRYLTKADSQLGTMTIHRHDVSQLGRKLVADSHLTSACLVEHRHLYAIAEASLAIHHNVIHILDVSVLADGIVGDVIVHILDVASITNGNIMQGDVPQACMLGDATF